MHSKVTQIQLSQFMGPDGTILWQELFRAVNVTDLDQFKELIAYLYFLDWQVAFVVNERLLEIAAGRLLSPDQLPIKSPTPNPLAWLHAEACCQKCPGSELLSYGEFSYPRCALVNKVERYSECLKYRENLESVESTQQDLEQHTQAVLADLKGWLNGYRADSRKDEDGLVGGST